MMSRARRNMEDEAAASHEKPSRNWKLPSERLVILVLVFLQAVALIVIYRLSFIISQSKTLQTLKEENEALSEYISRRTPPTCPTPGGQLNERCLHCEAGWEIYGGKCYNFTTIKSSWNDSRDGCKGEGGDLVKIDSREEQIFLEARLRDKMDEDEDKFWIGLTDSVKEGKWLWVDGSPLETRLSFWKKYEPDNWTEENPAGEDCARMGEKRGAADLKCWFDRSCNVPHKSICEKAADTKWI